MTADLPKVLYRADTVRELDRIAIEEMEIPGGELMARAGRAAFALLTRKWPRSTRVTVVCGRGNNAGDAYVVARLAAETGLRVDVLEVSDVKSVGGDAGRSRERLLEAGVRPVPIQGVSLAEADVIVDGIFGTGLDRPVEGHWRDAIDLVNDSAAPVLSLDIPSGLHADTGRVMGAAIRAAACVSFIGLKRGLFTGHGPDLSGEIHFDDLGVPPTLYQRVKADACLDSLPAFYGLLGPRRRNAHKGHFGHVLVVGGDRGFAGAARLAAEAALRCGAGLVSVATRDAHAHVINAGRYEIMARGVDDAGALQPLCDQASVLVVGPGLGRGEWGRKMLEAVLRAQKPTVVDADGLNLLCGYGNLAVPSGSVMTPHPGEAGRLLATDTATVESDRFAAVAAIAEKYACACVLKGAGTLTSAPGETTHVCAHGNPGMASGGMGDVLSGVIGALVAQGVDSLWAARAGACLHAGAGDEAARPGERGTLASDLMLPLRSLANRL